MKIIFFLLSIIMTSTPFALAKNKVEKLLVSCKTSRHTIKIDMLAGGTLVYSSWGNDKSISKEPDLKLKNGTWKSDGSGGNGQYDFLNKDYKYVLRDGMGVCSDYCGYYLEIHRKEKKILETKCLPASVTKEAEPMLGTWVEVKKYVPWMSEVEQTFRSTVTVSSKNEKTLIEVEIYGHHACGMQGFVTLDKGKIKFNSSDKSNRGIDSNFEKGKPCELILARKENKLVVESESSGCRAACGDKESFTGHEFSKQ